MCSCLCGGRGGAFPTPAERFQYEIASANLRFLINRDADHTYGVKPGLPRCVFLCLNMPEHLTRPKESRLRRKADYSPVYDRGERLHSRNFLVFALARSQGERARLGLAVTRKAGSAVRRNRIKRVLREFFRLHQHGMPSMDIVVTPKRHLNPDHICMDMAERELLPLLARLGLHHAETRPAP